MAQLPLYKVFPNLGFCLKICASNKQKNGIYSKALLEDEVDNINKLDQIEKELGIEEEFKLNTDKSQNQIKIVQSIKQGKEKEKQEENDPYLLLGYGMVAYFKMLKSLIFIFLIFTLLMLITLKIYSSYQGLEGLSNYGKAKYTLGNMGFSGTDCISIYLGLRDRELPIGCREGVVSEIYSVGLIPYNAKDLDPKTRIDYCGIETTQNSSIYTCTQQFVDQNKFKQDFAQNCIGQQVCQKNISISSYLVNQTTNQLSQSCLNQNSVFYFQYYCLQTASSLNIKRSQGLFISCLALLICFLFLLTIFYLYKSSLLEYKLWDVNTVTPADFTVEYIITEQIWDNFIGRPESRYEQNKVFAFQKFIKQELQAIVQNEEGVLQKNKNKDQQISISNITFAFNNVQLLLLLQQRGQMLTYQKFDKINNIDIKIKQLIENQAEEVCRPVAAFITFETQEGYERACNIKAVKPLFNIGSINSKIQFLDEPLYFKEAPEPTNIIWEHRDRTPKSQQIRKLIVLFIITLLLLLAFGVFFILKRQTILNQRRYPPSTDCDSILSIFNDNFTDPQFQAYANQDKIPTLQEQGTGLYQCFCAGIFKEYGSQKIKEISFCAEWSQDQFRAKLMAKVVSFSIVFINFALRKINMKLISFIGYYTESQQTQAIKKSVFIAQFFNTAILLLLTNANTQETYLSFLPFRGSYSDLTFEWYNDIGPSLVSTMLFAAYWPFIEFSYVYGLRFLFRCLDRRFSLNKNKTKSKSIQQYVNLYSGPDYLMHFKYSAIMNVIFVTFMYGLAIPVLFPIALLFFIIQYVVERLCITYFYKKPPMFDDRLNKSAIGILKWAPIFMLFFGFWIMGNRQIFSNAVAPKQYRAEAFHSQHQAIDFNLDQSLPLFIFGVLTFVMVFFNDVLMTVLNKIGLMKEQNEIEVDEKLGSYMQCLTQLQRKTWRIEELHMRKHFNIKTMDDETLDKLKDNSVHDKQIKHCHNYVITTNPKYAAAFQYTPIEMRDTAEEKETSDFVLKILNLPYFGKENDQIKNMKSLGSFGKNNSSIASKKSDQENMFNNIKNIDEKKLEGGGKGSNQTRRVL